MPYHKSVPHWNIIFLIYAELVDSATVKAKGDNTSADLAELESNILSVTLSNNFNLFTIKHVAAINDEGEFTENVCISLLSADDYGSHVLYQLSSPTTQNFLQNSENIKQTFKWLDQNYPADKNLLFTWGHGSAFGIFKKTLFQNKSAAADSLSLLSNDELASAITFGFKNQQAEAFIMFNCNMQNMHTCNAFKNCVKYLVAPQGAINAPGYDYVSIINLIVENGEATGEVIARHAVDTFKQNAIVKNKAAMAGKCALFAVSLADYDDKIVTYMRFFINELMELMKETPSFRADIRSFRGHQYSFAYNLGYFLTDLNNFLLKLTRRNDNIRLLNLCNRLRDVWESMVIAQSVGGNIYFDTVASWEKVAHIEPTGLSIYFPPTTPNPENAVFKAFMLPGTHHFSGLLDEIKWMGFLNELYKNPI